MTETIVPYPLPSLDSIDVDKFLDDIFHAETTGFFVPKRLAALPETEVPNFLLKMAEFLSIDNNLDNLLNEIVWWNSLESKAPKSDMTINASTNLKLQENPDLSGFSEEEKWQKSLQSQIDKASKSDTFVQKMYTQSLTTLSSLAPTLFKVGQGAAILATPVVFAIELTLGVISLLLYGEEAFRKKLYKQDVAIARKFYERVSVIAQELPDVQPIDELEKGIKTTNQEEGENKEIKAENLTVEKAKKRLQYILNATSEKSVMQSVEEFFAQFRIADGVSINRMPLYSVPVPLLQKHMAFGAEGEEDLRVEYMLYPLRVEEFLKGNDKSFHVVPTVPVRKTGSFFSDVEHSLNQIIAIVETYSKTQQTDRENRNKQVNKEEAEAPNNTEKKDTDTKKEELDIGKGYSQYFNDLKKIVNEMQGTNYSMTIKDNKETVPTTLWSALNDLFQEEQKKYYLANYFLWAAKHIIQSYIKWAKHELEQKE